MNKYNKIGRYNLIGINNISNSYVNSIANMKLISKEEEKQHAISILENRNLLIKKMFSIPHIAELFIGHFNKTRSSIIHSKYVFELSKYVFKKENEDIEEGEEEKERDPDDNIDDIDNYSETRENEDYSSSMTDEENSDIGDDAFIKKKKNIFNNIKNIINIKIKLHIVNLQNILRSYKHENNNENIALLELIENIFEKMYLNEQIVREMYTIVINKFNEITSNNEINTDANIFGLSRELFISRINEIKKYYKNVLLHTEKMVLSNLRLVISVSKKYINRRIDFMDIVQEGNLGLIKAIKKFDYRRGYKFSTYATWWIKQSITRDIYDNYDVMRIPIHMKEHISKVFKNIGNVNEELSYDDRIKTIMQYTKLDEKKIKKVFKIQRGNVSLDKTSIDGSSEDVVDYIDSNNTNISPFKYMVVKDKVRIIEKLVSSLNDREKSIFNLRFLNQNKYDREMTLEMIGYLKGITRERVRQILHKIIIKLINNKNNSKYTCVLQ